MNTLNPTKNPYLTGAETRTSTNNNRQGILAKLFGGRNNVNSLTQSSNTTQGRNSSKGAEATSITDSRTDISSSRADSQTGEQNQVNIAKANENLAQNSQIQGNTKEGGCSCGGGCAGGCGCGCG